MSIYVLTFFFQKQDTTRERIERLIPIFQNILLLVYSVPQNIIILTSIDSKWRLNFRCQISIRFILQKDTKYLVL